MLYLSHFVWQSFYFIYFPFLYMLSDFTFLCLLHFFVACTFAYFYFVFLLTSCSSLDLFVSLYLFIAVLHFYLTITHLISFSKFAPSHLFYILTTRSCVQWVCVTRSEGSTLQSPALLYPPLPQRGGPRSPTPVRWRSQPHSFPACLPLMKPWRLGGAHLQTGDSRGWTDVTDCIML